MVAATEKGLRWSTVSAVTLACVVLLPLLGHKPLTNWDEGIYAEVSREMLAGGWRVPHWNGAVWFEKPPLMLWVTAAFFRMFGVTESWARAGSAFSGVAVVGLVHGWLARRGEIVAAWCGTVILLGTFGFLHICRVGEMDVLLSLGCCVALSGLCAVGEGRRGGWYGFWAGFAVAAMDKGAASAVLPMTLLVVAAWGRWGWERFGGQFLLGLAGFLALVLPWHLSLWREFGRTFLDEYLGYHVLARTMGGIEGHATQWWFYLWVLLVSAPPFVLLYPLAVAQGLRQPELRVWAVFALAEVGLFSVVRTRLPHYIAPAYPAFALLTAVLVTDGWRQRQFSRQRWFVSGMGAGVFGGLLVLATSSARGRLHRAPTRLAEGRIDEREVVALAQRAAMETGAEGPLLVWWVDESRSVATCVFYAKREVVRVGGFEESRYAGRSADLPTAVGREVRVLLVQRELIDQIPNALVWTPLEVGRTMALGVVRRR